MSTANTNAPSYKLEIVAVVVHTAHTSHSAHSTTHAPHSAHTTHSAAHAAGHPRHRCRLLRLLGDRSFGGEHQPCRAGRILERRANYFGWIDHARLDEILVG